jgi:hypothetical protein
MVNSKRTCNLILGVGDGKLPAFRSVQYSGSNIRFFDDKNMQPLYDWHPRIDNVVYYGMDWLCPGYTKVLSEQLTQHHGNITAEIAISDIVAYTQTGNLGASPKSLFQRRKQTLFSLRHIYALVAKL